MKISIQFPTLALVFLPKPTIDQTLQLYKQNIVIM